MKLKPCPFCGHQAALDKDWGHVVCLTCYARGPSTVTIPDSMSATWNDRAEAWNKRITENKDFRVTCKVCLNLTDSRTATAHKGGWICPKCVWIE